MSICIKLKREDEISLWSMNRRKQRIVLLSGVILGVVFLGHVCSSLSFQRDSMFQNVTYNEYPEKIPRDQMKHENLLHVPGIGPVLASRIMVYVKGKKENYVLEDMTQVSGMGEKKINQLKKYFN